MSAALLYESHMHTPLCKHATGLPGEYAAVAQRKGLRGIIVTCHAPMPDDYSSPYRMRRDQFDEYVGLVAQATEEWRGKVDVRLGLESEFAPGYLGWIETLHGRAEFHHVLGSVHCQMREYIDACYKGAWPLGEEGPWLDFQRTYFQHLADAAETGLYDTISHPDLVKNMHPAGWDVARIMDDIRRALDRIAKAGTAMELNTSGRYKTITEMNPGLEILREMRERRIPVVIGADAHHPQRTGDLFPEALETLREAGYEEVSFFLDRQRHSVPIADALESLQVPASAAR